MPQCGTEARIVSVRHIGLVLTGGGARAAYQVGVLRALAEISARARSRSMSSPGSAPGAINVVGLATGADDFQNASERLAQRGARSPDCIFRTGALRLASIGTRWIRDLSAGALVGKSGINFLLDSAPLRRLVATEIPIGRMRRHLRAGRLRGVAVSATNYHTGSG